MHCSRQSHMAQIHRSFLDIRVPLFLFLKIHLGPLSLAGLAAPLMALMRCPCLRLDVSPPSMQDI
jgi:hypothetical protein